MYSSRDLIIFIAICKTVLGILNKLVHSRGDMLHTWFLSIKFVIVIKFYVLKVTQIADCFIIPFKTLQKGGHGKIDAGHYVLIC